METMNTMQGFEGFGGGDVDGDNGDDASADFMNSFKDFDFSSILGEGFDTESFLNSYRTMSSGSNDENENLVDNEANDNSNDVEDEYAADYNSVSSKDIINEDDDYSSMFEELKTMITPDQMQTFENLRMLFGSASYDDSNKDNVNKE